MSRWTVILLLVHHPPFHFNQTWKRETGYNPWHFGSLLRARRERPSRCSAAEQSHELAALHSITSSVKM
jgi:hypothetical protein